MRAAGRLILNDNGAYDYIGTDAGSTCVAMVADPACVSVSRGEMLSRAWPAPTLTASRLMEW